MTKPSRFLEKGRAAACGASLRIDSADSSENRIRVSRLTEPAVATHSAASVSPRRIASTPSWIALAPDAHAVESEIGDPLVPNVSARWSDTDPNRKRRWKRVYLPPPLTRSKS